MREFLVDPEGSECSIAEPIPGNTGQIGTSIGGSATLTVDTLQRETIHNNNTGVKKLNGKTHFIFIIEYQRIADDKRINGNRCGNNSGLCTVTTRTRKRPVHNGSDKMKR